MKISFKNEGKSDINGNACVKIFKTLSLYNSNEQANKNVKLKFILEPRIQQKFYNNQVSA